MADGYKKFLIGAINHFTRWKAPETTNKIILSRIKREQDMIRKVWTKNIHEILWPYHTTPHSNTQENPFPMVGEVDTMIPVEINTPTWDAVCFERKC